MRKKPSDRAKTGRRAPSKAGRDATKTSRKPSVRAKNTPHYVPREAKKKAPKEKMRLQGIALWGFHAVAEAWCNPARQCHSLRLTDRAYDSFQEILEKAEKAGLSRPVPLKVERSDIDAYLARGSVHQGILLEAEPLPPVTIDDLLGSDKAPSLVLVLDQVTDPHNVGAILRSAAAMGADAVIVTERNAPGTTGILAKTACGAVEHVPLIPVVNMVRALKTLQEESFWCIGLAQEGDKALAASDLSSGKIALVLGAEGSGLRRLTRQNCDELAHLPTQGPIASLNVSNAAVVALYEVWQQRFNA